MPKTLFVAIREFNSTVLTKGFILGILLTPVLVLLAILGAAVMASVEPPRVPGTVAVVDRTGLVADNIVTRFSPDGVAAERDRRNRTMAEQFDQAADAFGANGKQREMAMGLGRTALARIGNGPTLEVQVLPADADVESEKEPVRAAQVRRTPTKSGDTGADQQPPRIALVVIPQGMVAGGEPEAGQEARGADGPAFEIYYAPKLDFEVQQQIRERIAEAIVDARIATDVRAAAGGLRPEDVRSLLRMPRSISRTADVEGDKPVSKLTEMTALMLPIAFMLLLMMSVMTGGQYLLTTTIEEKGSRVMEVLLSAVSPMQLMVGKIVGQMGVGLLILILYSGVGIASLIVFGLQHMVRPENMVYLLVFFLIAFFLIASFMAAIGSAVTELREAQTLMTPVMAALIIPWLLVLPISRAPNAGWVTILSFVPGVNPFVMMIRLAGSEPIPGWQIPAAIAVGILSALMAAWGAAKVFRVGVLMYGKPPNFRTLWRWVRMA